MPYQKLPLTRIFCLSALLKMAFIEDFSLYRFIENCLYQGFFALLLHQKRPLLTFIEKDLFTLLLYQKRPLLAFIKNSHYQGFFALLLYQKWPLSRIFAYRFIENSLYWLLLAFFTL